MGKTAAELIQDKDIRNVDNPCKLIIRKSL